MQSILLPLIPLSATLQTKDIDLIQDVFESKMVIELLQMKRDEEMEWNQLFDRTVELAGGVDVLPSIHRRAIRQQHRVKAPVANPREYWMRIVYLQFLRPSTTKVSRSSCAKRR